MTQDSPPFAIDFAAGAVGYRFRKGGGRGEPLPRAIGMKGGWTPFIVDATAGMGRDSLLLASLGARIVMIERNKVIHDALAAAIEAARAQGGALAEAAGRMTLMAGDARALLADLRPEVVLVDPMHPERTKSALVKKEMRDIRGIVGADTDSAELMQAALDAASHRVVLKWPLRASPLDGIPPPSHRILGKTTRYDVFMRAGKPGN